MKNIVLWVMLSLAGFAFCFIGGFYFGGPYGSMTGFLAGMIMLMPLMQMIMVAKQKGFLPLYVELKNHEKFIHFPDNFGKLKTLIVNTKHEGVCHKKDIGFIEDKGTEFSWGKDPVSFANPKLGITIDIKNSTYTELLEKNRNIEDYDNAIEKFLGPEKYKLFCATHRKNPEPDIHDINKELEDLLSQKPHDELNEKVFGETWGFRNFLRFLKYAYHPLAMDVAVSREKLWTRMEAEGYAESQKAISWAKAAVMIIFAFMIFLIVMSTLDLSSLGGMFGGL